MPAAPRQGGGESLKSPSRDALPSRTPLVLASASPRRLALLRQIGIEPDRVIPAEIDESTRSNELPVAYARRMAREKAAAVLPSAAGAFVLAADTVVAVGRRILPKPADEAQARHCLTLLSGRRHRVLGAVFISLPDGRQVERLVTTRVGFKRLSRDEIEAYIASGEWRGKAGGYAIQGLAAALIPWIEGSYPNVVGLPVAEVRSLLLGLGYRPDRAGS